MEYDTTISPSAHEPDEVFGLTDDIISLENAQPISDIEAELLALARADSERAPQVLEMGRAIAERLRDLNDGSRLYIGYLASIITDKVSNYGKTRPRITIDELASWMGLQNSEIKQARSVVKFYGNHRVAMAILARFPSLTLDHLKTAARTQDLQSAGELLVDWAERGLSARAAASEYNKGLRKQYVRLWSGTGTILRVVTGVGSTDVTVSLDVEDDDAQRIVSFKRDNPNRTIRVRFEYDEEIIDAE